MEKIFEILLVEDNPADVRLTQEALKESSIGNNLNVVNDGVEALKFLRKEDKYIKAPNPDLILLDLNLPKKNGKEVLEILKQDESLRVIPVVVLTTSQSEDDIDRCYKLFANSYMIKPVDFDEFIGAIRSIEDYWLSHVKLPSRIASS